MSGHIPSPRECSSWLSCCEGEKLSDGERMSCKKKRTSTCTSSEPFMFAAQHVTYLDLTLDLLARSPNPPTRLAQKASPWPRSKQPPHAVRSLMSPMNHNISINLTQKGQQINIREPRTNTHAHTHVRTARTTSPIHSSHIHRLVTLHLPNESFRLPCHYFAPEAASAHSSYAALDPRPTGTSCISLPPDIGSLSAHRQSSSNLHRNECFANTTGTPPREARRPQRQTHQ